MKTILLTGGSGYLGRNLVLSLLGAQYQLILVVRNHSDLSYLDHHVGNFKVYRTSDTALEDIFKENQIDMVLHTAASYGRKGESLAAVIDANLNFPISLLTLAIQYKVAHFINTDTALPKELNWYSRSKKQFFEWLQVVSSSIHVVNLQLEYFYGPNDDSSKFITFVLGELESGKDHIDFTEATPLRDFIYIDDVVDAYKLIINKIDTFQGIQTIEIGSGQPVMLKDLIIQMQVLSNHTNVKLNFGALPMRPNEIMHSCADTTVLREMGWKQRYTFKEGILKTLERERK